MISQPHLRLLRLNQILDLTGLSRATLYRKIAAGTFPPPYRISERCSGWRTGEVEVWLHNPVSFTMDYLHRTDAAPTMTPTLTKPYRRTQLPN